MRMIKTSDRLPTKGIDVFVRTKSGIKTNQSINNESEQEANYWREAYEEWLDESADENETLEKFSEWLREELFITQKASEVLHLYRNTRIPKTLD